MAEARAGTSGIMAGCGLAVALLRAHLRKAALAAQAIGSGNGIEAVVAPRRVRKYVDDWVVWARAGARRSAEGARHAYDVLMGKLVEAGMQLNLAKSGVVASLAAGQGAARAAFEGSGAPVLPSVKGLGVNVCWGKRRQRARQ